MDELLLPKTVATRPLGDAGAFLLPGMQTFAPKWALTKAHIWLVVGQVLRGWKAGLEGAWATWATMASPLNGGDPTIKREARVHPRH